MGASHSLLTTLLPEMVAIFSGGGPDYTPALSALKEYATPAVMHAVLSVEYA